MIDTLKSYLKESNKNLIEELIYVIEENNITTVDELIKLEDEQFTINNKVLNKQERIKNIKGAFSINNEKMLDKNEPILIIDDITSSGITLKEIIVVLKKEGYKNILAIAFSTPDIWN